MTKLKPIRMLLRADGSVQEFDKAQTSAQIDLLIGADATDSVSLRHLHPLLHVMIVDDQGWETRTEIDGGTMHLHPVKPRKPLNKKATLLYWSECAPGTSHQIAGDVYICPDSDFAP